MIEIEIIIGITEMMIIAEEVIKEGIKGVNGINILEGVTIAMMPDGIEVTRIEAVTGELTFFLYNFRQMDFSTISCQFA